jgi:hypothetical protein
MLLISYHNIGWELSCLGDESQAYRWYHKALEMALVRLGEEAPLTKRLQKLVAGRALGEEEQEEGNQEGQRKVLAMPRYAAPPVPGAMRIGKPLIAAVVEASSVCCPPSTPL